VQPAIRVNFGKLAGLSRQPIWYILLLVDCCFVPTLWRRNHWGSICFCLIG